MIAVESLPLIMAHMFLDDGSQVPLTAEERDSVSSQLSRKQSWWRYRAGKETPLPAIHTAPPTGLHP